MIKPERLRKGDKVAIVSLSDGMLGEKQELHKYELGKKRLEEKFGLEVISMPNALKGVDYLYEHPEKRAEDMMNAFKDKSIKAIICAIGGDDTIRLLPYIDYDIIKNNPKIFMGFSDVTANHFMMYKAGVVSYYGPALISDFAEYVDMYDYTENAIRDLLFEAKQNYDIKKCNYWTNEHNIEWWNGENINKQKTRIKDEKGYEVIQGKGKVRGKLLGGCLDAFPIYNGMEVWPQLEEWKDKIIFLETCENMPEPYLITYYLRNMGAQGIFNVAKGIIVSKSGKYESVRNDGGIVSTIYGNYILTIMIKDFKDENYLNDEDFYNMGRKISNIIFNDYMRNWTKIKVIDNLEEGKEHGKTK